MVDKDSNNIDKKQAPLELPTIEKSTLKVDKNTSYIARLYNKVLDLANHKRAITILMLYSFLESIVLPIPTDILLAPIAMQHPKKLLSLSISVTVFSVLGGIVGFYIGFLFQDAGRNFVILLSNEEVFSNIKSLLENYGFIVILIVGFTPLPYKIFCITFGIVGVPLSIFIIYSFISRFIRFLIVTYLFGIFGNRYRHKIERIVNKSGWFILISCIIIFLIYYFYKV